MRRINFTQAGQGSPYDKTTRRITRSRAYGFN